MLTAAELLALALQCAPGVAPATMLAVVRVESAFDPLAIGVNGPRPARLTPVNKAAAVEKAQALIASGASVDLGLGQINSKDLGWLGLSVADAFDPCSNLAAAARVLQDGYDHSRAATIGEQPALRAALSRYNTGDPTRGLANGYVAKVARAAAQVVPEIRAEGAAASAPAAPPPPWDVFGQVGEPTFVIRISLATDGGPQ
jgi:type IV secretion system protein VirB1